MDLPEACGGQRAVRPSPERYPDGGETFGMVALPDGTFQIAWINGKSGVWQLYSSVIRLEVK